ncbi:nicotinate-nicotinamide nucleotide adenylyltransferase [Buchnera aphidicola (Diuraphis noxia)]|uniref:Probable nicotinate-nucleotide adenylyltransferase n=1 Tax=Buchnera aphidicola subsp. Diuraphis noxia TaxID=118101 RepID=A0A1B2H8U3_BUCDN|nr:nicotinate-nucleotide adenylyltransferase [Buchnera aphidicola]ANZ22640.1 nicotinate-nicotinamide nucleotide adenylyltransferase [Buchnera aphidicola (Diuraphis noxia)]
MKKLYAIFGGNFDPIHYGHIHLSKQLLKELSLKKIIFLPNENPPHKKKTKTSIVDRLKMIKLAINNHPFFQISYLETNTKKFFYTVDTLKKIRTKIGFLDSLCFIIGEDNLENLHLWKNWKEILLYSHLLIYPRTHIKTNLKIKHWINSHRVTDCSLLHKKSFGLIFCSNMNTINISSSEIRDNYLKGKNPHKLLPPIVHQYILSKKLYV